MKRSVFPVGLLLFWLLGNTLVMGQGPVVEPMVTYSAEAAPLPASLEKDLDVWYDYVPRRYVQADMLFWNRVGTGCDQVLAEDFLTRARVLSVGDLSDFRYEPGVRVTVGWQPDPCRASWCSAWEATYFGIFDWSSTAAAVADPLDPFDSLVVPGPLGPAWNFPLLDEIQADYRSELHSVELNCIKTCCLDTCSKGDVKSGGLNAYTQLDVLCGFRFINLQESFGLTTTAFGFGPDFTDAVGTYDISTDNYLYGVQLGGRLRRDYGLWAVEMRGKAGVFVNDARQRQTIVAGIPAGEEIRSTRGSGQAPAALGELGITVTRHLTSTWSIRGGYDALGLGGLALAPDQLDFYLDPEAEVGRGLHKTGWVFLHGAHVGLEARW